MATKKQMPMPARVKARKAANALMNGATTTQAIIEAGYSKSVARHCSGAILENIRRELAEQLDAQVDREALVANLLNMATGAKSVERIMHQPTGGVHQYTDPDFYIQVKATELLAKMLGSLVKREEISVKHEGLGEAIAKARARAAALEAQPDIVVEVVPEALPPQAENSEQQEGE